MLAHAVDGGKYGGGLFLVACGKMQSVRFDMGFSRWMNGRYNRRCREAVGVRKPRTAKINALR